MKKTTERHIVQCPSCGRDVLDHMTQCPFCGGELVPKGYQPPDPTRLARIRKVSYCILIPVAVALVIYLLFFR